MTGARDAWILDSVDRSHALRELPATHAVALRLRDNGFDDHVISIVLDIEEVQVPTLLRIAGSKLARLMALEARARELESRD